MLNEEVKRFIHLVDEIVHVVEVDDFLAIFRIPEQVIIVVDFIKGNHQFSRNQKVDRVTAIAQSVEGVEQVELRLVQAASMFVE